MKSWLKYALALSTKREVRGVEADRKRHFFRPLRAEQLEDRAMMAVSPDLDISFAGLNIDQNAINNGGSIIQPPDPIGAAGPNHVVNVTNTSIQWFTKDGVQRQQTSLRNFFNAVSPANATFDPKVIYDQHAGRFIVLTLERMALTSGDPLNASRILIGVSDDSDPNGNWYYQAINSYHTYNNQAYWADYPGLAVDDEAIYVTANMFAFNAGIQPIGPRIWILDKGSGRGGLYDGGRSSMTVHQPTGPSFVNTIMPAHVYGTTPTFGSGQSQVGTWFVYYTPNPQGVNDTLNLLRLDNPLTAPTFTASTVNLGDIDNASGVLNSLAPQRGSAARLETGDGRVYNAVWRNNSLYAGFEVVPNTGEDANQITAHWVRIDTTNVAAPTLADQGNIGGEDVSGLTYTYYPAVTVDKNGNMAVGFSASSPTMYAGAFYAVRAATDPAGTMRDSRTLIAGQDAYALGAGRYRWGDYSGMALDPADEVTFWAYNEYALPRLTTTGRWGTHWGSFHLSPLPVPPPPPTTPATIQGSKWKDDDSDGIRDANETSIAGVMVYLDLDGDNQPDVGEPSVFTDANGNYLISTTNFGTYGLREVLQAGWTQTSPGGAQNEHTVTLTAGAQLTGRDFGNAGQRLDFGDAPTGYPVTLAQDGARHGILSGFFLGNPTTLVAPQIPGVNADAETDGQPDVNAAGDDTAGTDDEGGVQFGTVLIAGSSTNSVQVRVSQGSVPSGYLSAWIDFNGDKDWNDAGEQIFAGRSITEAQGSVALTFTVPTGAVIGDTFARFRYSHERNLLPTGYAATGEVEDYKVRIVSNRPDAIDDTYTIAQNTPVTQMMVLANDITSTAGPNRITTVSNPASGGRAVIKDNGTPQTNDDFIEYSPLFNFFGTDTFTYTISDGVVSDTATVTVTVTSTITDPFAVDDMVDVPTLGLAFSFNVMNNDIAGPNGPIRITGITQSTNSALVLGNTATTVQVTAKLGTTFTFDTFTYTIADSSTPAKTSTATVTVRIGLNHAADDKVSYSIQTVHPTTFLPVSSVAVGDQFLLRVFANDLRPLTDPTTKDAGGNDRRGVFAAYMDLIYSTTRAVPVGPIRYDPRFANQHDEDLSIPGLINEVGGFGDQSTSFPKLNQFVFEVPMRAIAVGTAVFNTNPADLSPSHDTLVYQPPQTPVTIDKVTYGAASITITSAPGVPEGEFHNSSNALDVNNDGYVSAIDALIGINYLNNVGARDLRAISASGGEGESRDFIDVNGDGYHSAIDVLMVINSLNSLAAGEASLPSGGEGEGEGDDSPLFTEVIVSGSTPMSATRAADREPIVGLLLLDETNDNDDESMIVAPLSRTVAAALTDSIDVRQQTSVDVVAPSFSTVGQTLADLESVLDSMVDDVAGAWGRIG